MSECLNRAQDGTETDVDCGGANGNCARCQDGRACKVDSDCSSTDLCGVTGVCVSRAVVAASSHYVVTSILFSGAVAAVDFTGSAQQAVVQAVTQELWFRGVMVPDGSVVVVGVNSVEVATPPSGRRLGVTVGASVQVAVVGSSASALAGVPAVVSSQSSSLGPRLAESLVGVFPGVFEVSLLTSAPKVVSTKSGPLAPANSSSSGLPMGAIIGIVVGVMVLVVTVPLALYLTRPTKKAVKSPPRAAPTRDWGGAPAPNSTNVVNVLPVPTRSTAAGRVGASPVYAGSGSPAYAGSPAGSPSSYPVYPVYVSPTAAAHEAYGSPYSGSPRAYEGSPSHYRGPPPPPPKHNTTPISPNRFDGNRG